MLSPEKKSMAIKKIIKDKGEKSGVVYLVRHGETRFNSTDHSKDKIRGWLDIPLDDAGKKEAEKVGKYFADKNIGKIYYSDLSRTAETAKIIDKYVKAPMVMTGTLRPWRLGELQGQSSTKVHPIIEKYVEDSKTSPDGGETWDKFKNRFLDRMRETLDEADKTGKNILLVSHYRNLKAAIAWDKAGMKENNVDFQTMCHGDLETAAILKFTKQGNKWNIEHVKIN